MRRSGWHPLLQLRVRNLGVLQLLEGLDPVDDHRCQILIKRTFVECAPTFVRVNDPARITCTVEQAQAGERSVRIEQAKGWFGVGSIDEGRIAKAARSGDRDAMRSFAQSRSYRHLGRDNRVSDVVQFMDTRAALHWFSAAEAKGCVEAGLERAYLHDLIAQDRAYCIWRRSNPKAAIAAAPLTIRKPLSGSLAHAVCVRATERCRLLRDLIHSRQEDGDDWMDDYYRDEMQPGELYLRDIASRSDHPHLSAAIIAFLEKTCVPPFVPVAEEGEEETGEDD